MNKILRTILSLIALIYMGNVFASSQYLYLTKNSGYTISSTYPTIISSNSLERCIIDPDYSMPADCMYLDAPESQIGHYDTGAASYFYAHAVTVIGGYMYIISQDTSMTTNPSKRDVTWLQYCKISATDGGLSSCKYRKVTAGDDITPEIITSIASATIGGSNYVYIGGSFSQIFVYPVNSDGSLDTSAGIKGRIYNGDGDSPSGNTGDFIRDIYIDASNMTLYLTRGPNHSNSAYYEYIYP